jgi:hypothetical protein
LPGTSLNPSRCICWAAAAYLRLLLSSISRKRKACASATPSAPVCRNSICAVTLPYTVFRINPPMVPFEIGPLARTADPPVSESRWITPTNFDSSTEKIARSLFGTRIRGARAFLFGTFGLGATIRASQQTRAGSRLLTCRESTRHSTKGRRDWRKKSVVGTSIRACHLSGVLPPCLPHTIRVRHLPRLY